MATSAVHEELIPAGDIQLHVAQAGEPGKPDVFLLHGLYDRWESWIPVINDLAVHFSVSAPDLRGHARSSWPERGYLVENNVEDMVHLMDSLGITRSIPIGHSFGASIALALAAKHPDRVNALILADPPLEVGDQIRGLLEFLLSAKRVAPDETLEMVKELGFTSSEEEARIMSEWVRDCSEGPAVEALERYDAGGHPDYFEMLREVSCPTLVLQADPQSGGALTDQDAERAKSLLSDVTHRKFAGSGHYIHTEQPQGFLAAVTEFAQQHI